MRTITHLAVNRFGEFIWIDVEADGFLYNMVRAIAGTLVQVGRGFWPETQIDDVLKAMDRRLPARPPRREGLFLMRVTYSKRAASCRTDREPATARQTHVRHLPAELEIVPLAKPPSRDRDRPRQQEHHQPGAGAGGARRWTRRVRTDAARCGAKTRK